jgi:hypothetical protein
MAKAFLDCGLFNEINGDFNLDINNKYTYSPTKHVIEGLYPADISQYNRLIEILRSSQSRDLFWGGDGEQPADMMNPPEPILRTEQQRKASIGERSGILEQQDFKHLSKIKNSFLNRAA